MRTRRPTMSLEGTLEVIDLSHASDEEAMAAVLQELRARREGRPRRQNGPALMIELGRLDGARGQPPAGTGDDEPRGRPHPRGGERGPAGPCAAPFSLADLGEVLRQMGGAAEPESTQAPEPRLEETEERAEVEQFVARRTVIVEDDGAGKMMAAAVVGFGLGAAAMFLARRFRYVAPPSSRRERPRRPHGHIASDAEWQAQLDEIARRYADSDGDEQDDDDEPSPGE